MLQVVVVVVQMWWKRFVEILDGAAAILTAVGIRHFGMLT